MSFKIQNLQKISDCFPRGVDSQGPNANEALLNAQLLHLEYLPQGPDNRREEPSRPCVLGSFTDVSDQYNHGGASSTYTIICRWELHSVKPQVHPHFETLGSKPQKISKRELPVCQWPRCCCRDLLTAGRQTSSQKGCLTYTFQKSCCICSSCASAHCLL